VSVKKTKEDLEDVSLLKFALTRQLQRMYETTDVDVVMFSGIDGKIYSSYIPENIGSKIFELTNLITNNMHHIAQQLELGLNQAVIEYDMGTTAIFSSVGKGALLISLFTGKTDLGANVHKIEISRKVIKHIFEQKPMTSDQLDQYSSEVSKELRILSRNVFEEMYTHSSEYKKNMEILADIKTKISTVMGKTEVDQVLAMAFYEVASSPKWMNEDLWIMLLDLVINEQIRPIHGDYVADLCESDWIPDIKRKLEAFV